MKIGKFNEYKGYIGSIEFSSDDNCYLGKIYGINDLILYEAKTVEDLYEEFKKLVNNYIGILEQKNINKETNNEKDKLSEAKKILSENGYIVKKWTRSMEQDANECVDMEEHGQTKDCSGCSCLVCLMQ